MVPILEVLIIKSQTELACHFINIMMVIHSMYTYLQKLAISQKLTNTKDCNDNFSTISTYACIKQTDNFKGVRQLICTQTAINDWINDNIN